MTGALASRDVVCVGFNDWDNEIWTNQHHLMSRLAASGSRVLFIESLGLRRPDLGSGRDLRRIAAPAAARPGAAEAARRRRAFFRRWSCRCTRALGSAR